MPISFHTQPRMVKAIAHLRASYALDYRSLATFRILVALVVLAELAQRFGNATVLYSDLGILPRTSAIPILDADRWSVLFLNGSPEFARMVIVIGMIAAGMMLVGSRTRAATIVLWVVVVSLQARNNHLAFGADTLMRLSLFWGMFLPVGAVWSFDRQHSPKPTPNTIAILATFALIAFGLLLQLACMYLFSALLKDGPRWRDEGNAVYYALGVADVSNPIGDWLFHTAPVWFFQAATTGTLLLEFAVPFVLIIPTRSGWLRTTGVLLVIGLHLGIASTMWVGWFGAISIASITSVLPSQFWSFIAVRLPASAPILAVRDSLRARIDSRFGPGQGLQVAPARPVLMDRQHMLNFRRAVRPDRGAATRLVLNSIGAVSIALMVIWNVSTVSSYQPPEPISRLAMATGIFQQWSMFSPNPQGGTLRFVIEGELASGEKVDVMVPMVTGDVSVHRPVVWDQSEGHVMTNKYWRKYFEAIKTREGDLFAFANYACRTWNTGNNGESRLRSLRISQGFATTLPNSERADPVFTPVGTWNCG